MTGIRAIAVAALLAGSIGATHADDISDAIDMARKAYQTGDMANAKQSLDLASQLIGQKNADSFAALLPEPLPGWKAERAQSTAVGAVMYGASMASRSYSNAKGDNVEVQITGDSALVMQFATLLSNPQFAGAMGRLVRVGNQRAIQTAEGDVNMVIGNKVLVTVNGSGSPADKIAYAQAIDVLRLTKL